MKRIFDNKERINLEPSKFNETTFEYLDSSATEVAGEIRKTMNDWFSNYPESEQEELKRRFKKAFSSAYYELFLHELFIRQGFTVTIHPTLISSTRHPDFLIEKNGQEFYVEAKEIRFKSHKAEADEKRLNQFYDGLNKADASNFLLWLESLEFKNSKQPSTKLMIKNINAQLMVLNPDEVYEKYLKFGLDGKTTIRYEDDDVKLSAHLMPKIPAARNIPSRAIGALPSEVIFGGSDDSIFDAFKEKAKRYGELDKPFIICLNLVNTFESDFAVENFLWGSLAVTFSMNPKKRDERLERLNDGIFQTNKGPRFTNVNGILLTKVAATNVKTSGHWFAKHPFVEGLNGFENFEVEYKYVKNERIISSEGKSLAEILS